jgi:hypothetical protein
LKQKQKQSQNVIVHVHTTKEKRKKKSHKKGGGGGGGVQVLQPIYKTVVPIPPMHPYSFNNLNNLDQAPPINYSMHRRNITDVNKEAQSTNFQNQINQEESTMNLVNPENKAMIEPIAKHLSEVLGKKPPSVASSLESVMHLSDTKVFDNPMYDKGESSKDVKTIKHHHHEAEGSTQPTKNEYIVQLQKLENKYNSSKQDTSLKEPTREELMSLAHRVANEFNSESLKTYLSKDTKHQSKALISKINAIINK